MNKLSGTNGAHATSHTRRWMAAGLMVIGLQLVTAVVLLG